MKVVALVSGGKDSTLSMLKCMHYGHEIVCLANLRPPATSQVEELDSYCFQTVGQHAVAYYSQCCGIPLYTEEITAGASIHTGLRYQPAEGDEVEVLHRLLQKVIQAHPEVTAVCTGAILSDYQRLRVEHVCARLKLTSLAYLWQYSAERVLRSVVASGVRAYLVKVSAMGLSPQRYLGRVIDDALVEELLQMPHIHAAGEGGEFETFTVDCPLFRHGYLELVPEEAVSLSDDKMCPTAMLRFHVVFHERSVPPVLTPEQELSLGALDAFHKIDVIDPIDESLEGTTSASFVLNSDDPTQCFAGFEENLRRTNHTVSDVFLINVVVKSMNTFLAVNGAFKAAFGNDVPPPVRAFVATEYHTHVVSLYVCACNAPRDVLQVQSISEWSAACIGPYAQSCRFRSGVSILAGTLGLLPPTMTLEGDFLSQADRALLNIARVLEVQLPALRMEDVVSAIVYVVDAAYIPLLRPNVDAALTHAPEIVFVVVTELPRNALVEIQTVARHWKCVSPFSHKFTRELCVASSPAIRAAPKDVIPVAHITSEDNRDLTNFAVQILI